MNDQAKTIIVTSSQDNKSFTNTSKVLESFFFEELMKRQFQ